MTTAQLSEEDVSALRNKVEEGKRLLVEEIQRGNERTEECLRLREEMQRSEREVSNHREYLEIFNRRIETLEEENTALKEALERVQQERTWYKSRVDLLQDNQSTMRDPERTLVCDILANGQLWHDKSRYALQTHVGEPIAWVRFCSDGGIEGPLLNNDRRMDEVRKRSGAWTPLGLMTNTAPEIAAKTVQAGEGTVSLAAYNRLHEHAEQLAAQILAADRATPDARGHDAARWIALEALMLAGNVELNQHEDGGFSIVFEGAECADQVWRGDEPEEAVDKVVTQLGLTPSLPAAECPVLDGWQPIDTAPKDGFHILLFKPEITYVGFWADAGWCANASGCPTIDSPTHWMPLPDSLRHQAV